MRDMLPIVEIVFVLIAFCAILTRSNGDTFGLKVQESEIIYGQDIEVNIIKR